MRGSLRLGFEWDGARTRLTGRAHEPPLQVIRAFDLAEGASLVHLHNTSGGVLGGDVLTTDIHVGPRAQAQVTTTGATRLYRSRAADHASKITTRVSVAEEGLLEYLPDPVIPFAGSRSSQETRIALAPGAGLFWWETLAPGRTAHGEVFAYERLDWNLDLAAGGRLIAQERMRLEPARRPPSSPARLGPYRYLCTFYICRVGVPPADWLTLERALAAVADRKTRPGEALWGVSTLPAHGLTVRGLSVTGRDLAPGLLSFWRLAKQELYGREISLPRKVY